MPVTIKTTSNAVKVNTGNQKEALTIEEQLVQTIGSTTIDKAAVLKSQIDDLEAQIKALASDFEPLQNKIKEALAAANLPPTKKLVLKSDTGSRVEVAACRKSTVVIDKEALYHALEETQEGLYFDLSSVGLTDAKKYVPVEGNLGKIFDEQYGKTRTLKFKV